MTDQPRDPRKPGDPESGPPDLRELLSAVEPPAHRPEFWRALDARIDLVTVLRDAETPQHHEGFWPSFDAALRAEPERQFETAEVVTLRTTVFDDALPPTKRARRNRPRQPWSRRRLETLVQLSAAAAVLALLAGALAWWGTREPGDTIAATGPENTRPTTTTVAGPPTSILAPPLYTDSSRIDDVQTAPLARGSVPVGASPDGKFLYMAAPAQSNERCTFSPNSALSTAAMWLYAQPVDGSSPGRRILTDRVFADPKMVAGPSEKVVVSDSCNGATTHLIASAEQNGALSTDRVVASPPATPLAVDGAAWSASGTGLYLRAEGAAGWFRYDLASGGEPSPVPEISPAAQVVEQLVNEQLVSVTRRSGAATWAVSVGNSEVVAIGAPSHNDFARAVRVDTGHGQLAIAGKDTLLVLTARAAGVVDVSTFKYAAEAVTWAADGNGLVAAPVTGGLDYLTFVPSAANQLTTVSLGYSGVAYSVLSVPTSSSLVIRQAVAEGDNRVAGEAYLLKLTS
ncbi:MAG TPA: hypothetical protein VM282_20030 [Acidimicrobiales bacterium]|nr:hypothetical protein [Acidimicrobiales bacterium]